MAIRYNNNDQATGAQNINISGIFKYAAADYGAAWTAGLVSAALLALFPDPVNGDGAILYNSNGAVLASKEYKYIQSAWVEESAATVGDNSVTNAKLAADVKVGSLATLATTEVASVVGAINEVNTNADTANTSIGTLASLTTTAKSNLVVAINEVDASAASASAAAVAAEAKADVATAAVEITSYERNHIYYVDGSRTDSYTEDGTYFRPYKKISTVQTVINALADAQIAIATQAAWDTTRYIVKIAEGIYSDAISITNMKYLRYDMDGATISGNITIATTMVGGPVSDYYGRVEFRGMTGTYRVEKGRCALISGDIVGTRNNDSLMYLSFNGVQVSGNVSVGTSAADSNGTWVISCQNAMFSGTTKFISAYMGLATSVILVESSWSEFKCHFAKQDGTACNIDLYTCDNTNFDLINITPVNECRFTNCTFNSDVSIVAAKNLKIDANSSMSMFGQTETLTGMTIVALDGVLKSAATVATRAAARALVGDGVAIGTILIGGAAVATTKPNVYIKVLNAAADTDWERIVTQASD